MHASKRPAGTLPAHIVHDSGRSKTVCTSAVLIHFGVCAHMYHYSSRPGDVERILRAHGYSVRSRRSKLSPGQKVVVYARKGWVEPPKNPATDA